MIEQSTHTDQELERLCALLDSELDRQRAIVRALDEQAEAARVHDLDRLDESTDTLSRLQRESFESERERLQLLAPIVKRFDLHGADQTLSNLITRVPAPWNTRLETFQREIRETIAQSRERSKSNTHQLRGGLRRVGRVLNSVLGDANGDSGNYTPRGSELGRRASAAVLDASG